MSKEKLVDEKVLTIIKEKAETLVTNFYYNRDEAIRHCYGLYDYFYRINYRQYSDGYKGNLLYEETKTSTMDAMKEYLMESDSDRDARIKHYEENIY